MLTFPEAAKGCTKNLSFDADVPCDSCREFENEVILNDYYFFFFYLLNVLNSLIICSKIEIVGLGSIGVELLVF